MFAAFFNAFTKITAWPLQKLCFRTKISYEDAAVQKRHIKGAAIVICNHTSVFDYAVLLFVFFTRTLRCLVAELIFEKKPLGAFVRLLGAIRVDRNAHDFSFLYEASRVLQKGGVVLVFPESRIPRPDEARPLAFKPSAAYLALDTGVPVIPVCTNGSYFSKKRARIMIGTPLYAGELCAQNATQREDIACVNDAFRQKIMALEDNLYARNEKRTEARTDC